MSESGTSPVIPGSQANHSRPVLWLITLVAVGLSLFQLYSAGIQPLGLFYQRSIHLMLIMLLAFLMFPLLGPKHDRGPVTGLVDAAFCAGALVTGGYLVLFLDERPASGASRTSSSAASPRLRCWKPAVARWGWA